MKLKLLLVAILFGIAAFLLSLEIRQDAQRKEEPTPFCPPFCVANCIKLDRAWLDRGWKE